MTIDEMIDYTIGVRRAIVEEINEGLARAENRGGEQITKLMYEEYTWYGEAEMKIERLTRGYVRKGDLE